MGIHIWSFLDAWTSSKLFSRPRALIWRAIPQLSSSLQRVSPTWQSLHQHLLQPLHQEAMGWKAKHMALKHNSLRTWGNLLHLCGLPFPVYENTYKNTYFTRSWWRENNWDADQIFLLYKSYSVMQKDKNYWRSVLTTQVIIKAPRYWGIAPGQTELVSRQGLHSAFLMLLTPQTTFTIQCKLRPNNNRNGAQAWAHQRGNKTKIISYGDINLQKQSYLKLPSDPFGVYTLTRP